MFFFSYVHTYEGISSSKNLKNSYFHIPKDCILYLTIRTSVLRTPTPKPLKLTAALRSVFTLLTLSWMDLKRLLMLYRSKLLLHRSFFLKLTNTNAHYGAF